MAQPSTILTADRGRASATAWGILCALLLLQTLLVIYLVVTRPKAATTANTPAAPAEVAPPPLISIRPPPVGSLTAPSTRPAATAAPGPSYSGPPPIGSLVLPSAPSAPVSAPPAPSSATPASAPPPPSSQPPGSSGSAAAPAPALTPSGLPDPTAGLKRLPLGNSPNPAAAPGGALAGMSAKEMVEMAKQVRSMGDMQGALEALNKADLHFPNDPSIVAEMAQTYEKMGLDDKAAALWRRLEAMNPQEAAGYREMASRRLGSPSSGLTKSIGTSTGFGADSQKILSLGPCQATRDPSVVNGEKVVLRIPILRQGMAPIDPSQVDIDVYFFDRVNGEKVAQTIADDPVTTWGSPPVDWSGIGEEPLNVTYFLPQLTPGEIQAHGRRSYHGYLVKLYYQHKLQDVAAEPRDLLDFGSNTPQAGAGLGNPLLPPVSQ